MDDPGKEGKVVIFIAAVFWPAVVFLHVGGVWVLFLLAGLCVLGLLSGVLSVSYCIKVAVLAAAGLAVLQEANTAALIGAVAVSSLWHLWTDGGVGEKIILKRKARRRQEIFFDAIFLLLGYIAKADGVVRGRDINFAAMLMMRMQMDEERKAHAREAFLRGKDAAFDIDKTLQMVREECAGNIGIFMRILSHAAAVHGDIGEVKSRILHYAGTRLGLSESEVQQIEAAARGGENRNKSYSYGNYGNYGNRRAPVPMQTGELQEAYMILGVPGDATDNDVKRSYRRQMSRHHPDKVSAKGIPPEMMRIATERAQDITRAYERIKKSRGI